MTDREIAPDNLTLPLPSEVTSVMVAIKALMPGPLYVGDPWLLEAVFTEPESETLIEPASVTWAMTRPNGTTQQLEGVKRGTGYIINPYQQPILSEPGVWKAVVSTLAPLAVQPVQAVVREVG